MRTDKPAKQFNIWFTWGHRNRRYSHKPPHIYITIDKSGSQCVRKC